MFSAAVKSTGNDDRLGSKSSSRIGRDAGRVRVGAISAAMADLNMFNDAVKSTGNDDRLGVVEIIELVASCMDLESAEQTDEMQAESGSVQ